MRTFVACVLLLMLAVCPSGALASANANWGKGIEANLPANAGSNPEASLGEVLCHSVGNCTAVGTYIDSSGYRQGLLLSETGGTWGPAVEAAVPAAAASNPHVSLGSLSCPSAGTCTAIGNYRDSAGHEQGFLLNESAGTWVSGMEASLPANAGSNPEVVLQSVSCPSTGNCTAVGDYTDGAGDDEGFLLSETSGTWGTAVEASLPANVASNPEVVLQSVSCPSAGECSAIGEYTDSFEIEHALLLDETSGTWGAGVAASLPANVAAGAGGQLTGLSCPSAGHCVAVGHYASSVNGVIEYQGLLLTETAGTWGSGVEAIPPANTRALVFLFLEHVSCASVGNCTAVGDYIANSNPLANPDQVEGVLLTEASGVWGKGVEAPLPANAHEEEDPFFFVGSISCPSAGNCSIASDYVDSASHSQGLLLTENSGSWPPSLEAVLPADTGPDPKTFLGSVSCAAPGNCVAVGSYFDSSGHKQGLLLTAAPTTANLSASGPLGGAFVGSPIAASQISAALAGGSAPSGPITFTVFGPQATAPTSCTSGGTVVGTASAYGDGTYQPSAGFAPSAPGDYWWYASYGGDVGDEPSTSTCGPGMAETTVGPKTTPILSASGPLGGVTGSPIAASSISAALADGSTPTGAITFTVFGPQPSPPSSCASGGTTIGTASVNGNGTYQPSAGFTPQSPGEYWWYASYGGSDGDEPAASACGALMAQTLVAGAPTTGAGTSSNPGSVSSGLAPGAGAITLAPRLSAVKLGSTRSTEKKGIALKLTLSQPGTIKILIAQIVKAHKHGRLCTPTAKKGKSCTTTVRRRTLTFPGSEGVNALELKLAGLGKGSYTVTIVAENANGSSSSVGLTFTITGR